MTNRRITVNIACVKRVDKHCHFNLNPKEIFEWNFYLAWILLAINDGDILYVIDLSFRNIL